ncbi:hypothetical protein SAY87_002718 [Trapa incisa]|uniref:Protein kinase domain-containing protein n=1 Tax=Trapa incisa TaxID=236973 RepID=A0AAN7JVJ4_9MYRT|nr:hypothetical protein SAY87_002718 [Trapa incisa]
MTVPEQVKTAEEKRKKCVVVGIRLDGYSRELISWAIVKVADPGDQVLALHVCHSDGSLEEQSKLDSYLEVYEGLCNVKKVDLEGKIVLERSIRRALVREAKKLAAVALVVGEDKHNVLGICTGTAKYCAKRLPSSTDVLSIHNGKVVFRRFGENQLTVTGAFQDPRPSLCSASSKDKDIRSELTESEAEDKTETENSISTKSTRIVSTRITSISRPGWPLLRRTTSEVVGESLQKLSVVQWAMSLPDRSQYISAIQNNMPPADSMIIGIHQDYSSAEDENLKGLERHLLNRTGSSFIWFDLEELKKSTSHFSSENLIGKGGWNRVYRGTLSDGHEVAVKVLKLTEGSRKDFALEMEIVASLNHRFIVPLHGICVGQDSLLSVYDFLSKGSLEDNLHVSTGEGGLPWKARFSIAIGIAEALDYLHNEIPRAVIHRDIKSSNILLNDCFEPKLSDFGLAMWSPTALPYQEVDLVGTFGYLAPEYFMSGKVSDRVDVYSFGVVLLELLSGRRPISSDGSKGRESLVLWAKPMIAGGDVRGILDPRLDGDVDEVELRRMVSAAVLCLKQAPRLRPGINQIVKILKGDCEPYWRDIEEMVEDDADDGVYPESSAASRMGLALLNVCDDDSGSLSGSEQPSDTGPFVEEYVKGRWSRSPTFD